MKKSLTIALGLATALGAQAAAIVPMGPAVKSQARQTREYVAQKPSDGKTKASSLSFDPYYPAPEGVLYLGLGPKAERSGSLFALAPLNRLITYKSGFSTDDGDYTWDYTDQTGKAQEANNKDITLAYTEKKAYDAPYLYCIGYGGRGGYSFARDGVAAGYGSLPSSSAEYYGSNLDVANLAAQFYDPTTLSVNYPDANTNLLKYYQGTGISQLTIKGFAESFGYCGDYALEAVRADMVYADGTAGNTSHFVAEVYPMTAKGVDFDNLIATLPATQVTKHDDYFYNFEFTPDQAPRITGPVMLVFVPTDACTSIVSPAQYALTDLHEADKGTAYMYASYKFGDTDVDKGALLYSGVELEGRYTYWHNHWNVSIKRTYLEDLPRFSTANAYQMGDDNSKFGFVTFATNDLSTKQITKAVGMDSPQVGAAEYMGGKLYAYTVYQDYLYGDGLATDAFVVYDPAKDFEVVTTTGLAGAPRVADMAFDYTTNTMFALVEQNKDDAGRFGLTCLATVNLADGSTAVVGNPGDIRALNGNGRDVEEHLVALAASPDGRLYAMGEYRRLYSLDKRTGLATAVGERKKVAVMNDFQSMAFNKDGELFHALRHPDYEYFMRIDPADGRQFNPETGDEVVVNSDFTNNALRIAGDPQLTGLYFADRDVDAAAPLAVTGLTATLREGVRDKVDLEWTLPAQNWGGAGAGVTAVKVYRFGTAEPLATLGATATSFTDGQAPDGVQTYSVVCMAGESHGFTATASVFAGHDRLQAVTGLTAALEGNDLSLEWQAPTATVNGGYADYDNITYEIHRISGDTRRQLADAHTDTRYAATHTDAGTFTFEVVPVSGGVRGVAAVSNEVVMAANVATIPYSTGFEDDQDGTQWTATNANASYGWSIQKGYSYQQYDGKFAQFKTGGGATIPRDDLFASPEIKFEAGKHVLTYMACGGSIDKHTFNVYLSSTPTGKDRLIQSVQDQMFYNTETGNKNFYQEVKVPFEVEQPGTYHLVLNGIGASTYATLKIDNLSIDKDNTEGVGAIDTAVARIEWDAAARTARCSAATAFEAYDLQGAKVAAAQGGQLTVDAPAGIYLLRAVTPAGTFTLKVAVK